MTALPLNPYDNNILSCRLINQQLIQNQLDVTLHSCEAVIEPKVVLDGTGRAYLQGSVAINTTPSANLTILDLPTKLIPVQEYSFPVSVIRAGAYVTNAVKLESEGVGLASATVTVAGSYATIPTLAVVGVGSGATVAPYMKIVTPTVVTAQSGGGSYAPGNVLEFVGGEGEAGRVTVTNTKVVSATIAAEGASGTPGTQTVTGTTGTGTKFQATVTVSGAGVITSVDSISVAGNYTVNPTSLTAEPVTGGGLVGAQLNVKIGVLTAIPSVSIPGGYTTLPTSPISTTTISGTGTGATFSALWGIGEALVTNQGTGYGSDTTIDVSGGGGSGGGEVVPVLGEETGGTLSLVNSPNEDDIISLDGISFLVEAYY